MNYWNDQPETNQEEREKIVILIPMMTTAAMLLPASTATEPRPKCETVLLQEGSGEGPTYKIHLCGGTFLPVRRMIVDGSRLPERNTHHKPVVFWTRH